MPKWRQQLPQRPCRRRPEQAETLGTARPVLRKYYSGLSIKGRRNSGNRRSDRRPRARPREPERGVCCFCGEPAALPETRARQALENVRAIAISWSMRDWKVGRSWSFVNQRTQLKEDDHVCRNRDAN